MAPNLVSAPGSLGRITPIMLTGALAVIGAGAKDSTIWLHYVFKPLTTLLIFMVAWSALQPANLRYRRAVLIGIALSFCGDIFLMLPRQALVSGFLLGLSSFLAAHLCFLFALSSDARLFSRSSVFAFFLLAGAANLAILWNGIGNGLRLPVVLYMLCLLAMASQAMCRHLQHRNTASRFAAVGGVLFMASDTLLAYNKFHAPLPLAPLWILGTYYSALLLVARSVEAGGSEPVNMMAPKAV
jgi:uncharacterized membrane protein YhhN